MRVEMLLDMREEAEFWISPARGGTRLTRATVVIPTYNAEPTLTRAARSALEQTASDIELLIIDDASTDNSWQIISALTNEDRRVRAIRNKRNSGKSASMNRAIHIARGEWFAVLDADDWYHPDRLSALLGLAEQRQVDLVADNQFLYDARADRMVGTAWPTDKSIWEMSFDDFLIGSDAYQTFNLGMLKPILRLDFMRRMGVSYEEKLRLGEDFLHLLHFYLAGGKAVVSDQAYYYYTQPFGSISRQWSHETRTRYDFQNACEINVRCLDNPPVPLTSGQCNHLETRRRRLRSLEYYFRAKDAIARRDWLAALATLAGHPGSVAYLLSRLRGRILPPSRGNIIDRIAARSRRRLASDEQDVSAGRMRNAG